MDANLDNNILFGFTMDNKIQSIVILQSMVLLRPQLHDIGFASERHQLRRMFEVFYYNSVILS